MSTPKKAKPKKGEPGYVPPTKTIFNSSNSVIGGHFANVEKIINQLREQKEKNILEKKEELNEQLNNEETSLLFVLNSAIKANNDRIVVKKFVK